MGRRRRRIRLALHFRVAAARPANLIARRDHVRVVSRLYSGSDGHRIGVVSHRVRDARGEGALERVVSRPGIDGLDGAARCPSARDGAPRDPPPLLPAVLNLHGRTNAARPEPRTLDRRRDDHGRRSVRSYHRGFDRDRAAVDLISDRYCRSRRRRAWFLRDRRFPPGPASRSGRSKAARSDPLS